MNYLDLFHGIGGFPLGMYWAGIKVDNHFCSDIEPYAVELYKLRFPDSVQLGDITKIDFKKLKKDFPDEWLITGGFPCQDISVAGKGKGLIDEKTGEKTRSGLWFDYKEAIRILRPRFAIIENVRALLNRGLETVLSDLAEIGYNAEWQIISAADMGAPHKRERIWIFAYSDSTFSQRKRESGGHEKKNAGEPSQCNAGPKSEVADTKSANDKRWNRKRKSKQVQFGGSSWWTVEPNVGRLANGVSNRVDRLKGLGNSIVPQISQLLFEQIKGFL
jgi:DNA (cytosine-5)-methyltransferase 1